MAVLLLHSEHLYVFLKTGISLLCVGLSPPARGAWIEIVWGVSVKQRQSGRPPHGGRGLKYFQTAERLAYYGRPPHGGRGLKFFLRRLRTVSQRRPPHGGRGLKFLLRLAYTIENARRPPHGGRGLK